MEGVQANQMRARDAPVVRLSKGTGEATQGKAADVAPFEVPCSHTAASQSPKAARACKCNAAAPRSACPPSSPPLLNLPPRPLHGGLCLGHVLLHRGTPPPALAPAAGGRMAGGAGRSTDEGEVHRCRAQPAGAAPLPPSAAPACRIQLAANQLQLAQPTAGARPRATAHNTVCSARARNPRSHKGGEVHR